MFQKNAAVEQLTRKLRTRKRVASEVIHLLDWCMQQDWSYGNHGPDGVPDAIRDALAKLRTGKPEAKGRI